MLGNLYRPVVDHIADGFEEIAERERKSVNVDVWLQSGGGDAHAAYKLFLVLRERCERLRVIVPDYAKSAATLFALGCDEIFMATAAELGPLDVQIPHPDREGVPVSGLDVANAIQFLAEFAVDYGISGGASVLEWTKLPRSDVLREFLGFVSKFLEPAVSKLDPNLIHRAKNQLRIAQDYAARMLANRRVSEDETLSMREASELTKNLVERYPAHGFVISRSEAKRLGLPIRNADDHPQWHVIRDRYETFREKAWRSMMGGQGAASDVCWIPDDSLENDDDDENSNSSDEAPLPEAESVQPTDEG